VNDPAAAEKLLLAWSGGKDSALALHELRHDRRQIAALPADADPCGENGEFHSFVYDGPIFARHIAFRTGETVLRAERFCFCDLIATD